VSFEILVVKYALEIDQGFRLMLYFAVMMIIYTIVFFSWLWAVGNNLYKKLQDKKSMKIKVFRILLIIPFVYIIITTLFLQYTYNLEEYPLIIPAFLFPLHILVMFCLFYCFWFISKAINLIEKNQDINLKDYSGDFFLIWFFPIGIWVLQPRINAIFD
jgi:fatty acid desaturase